MEKYSIPERTQIVKLFYQNRESIISTQRAYRRHYQVRNAPSDNAIRSIVRRFEQQGAVTDLPRTGRPRNVRTDENRERVREIVEETATTSTRRRSTELGISRSSLRRILHSLQLFPYKVQMVQELKPADYEARLQCAIRLQELAQNEPNFIQKLLMSDEAHFHLNGFINTQNYRFWGSENPRIIQMRQLHPIKCTVWCAMMADKIIGPYFFEDDNGNPVTVTGERYRAMIRDFLRPQIANMPGLWFQQDGATAHTARETMHLLTECFDDKIISRNGNVNWPSRFPDLTSPDFFLWGYLKDKVFANKPRTLQELKDNIRNEIMDLNRNPEIFRAVSGSVLERAIMCQNENGRHLKDVIFHK